MLIHKLKQPFIQPFKSTIHEFRIQIMKIRKKTFFFFFVNFKCGFISLKNPVSFYMKFDYIFLCMFIMCKYVLRVMDIFMLRGMRYTYARFALKGSI